MKFRHSVTTAALLALVSVNAYAERWLVSEGQQGEWKGTWVLKASTGDFKINLRQGNSQINAEGFYIRNGNVISIARTRSSDGNDCHYMGTITGDKAAGTMFCGSGGPYRWNAVLADAENPTYRTVPLPPQR
jgi:hypothetical protein